MGLFRIIGVRIYYSSGAAAWAVYAFVIGLFRDENRLLRRENPFGALKMR